MEKDYQNPRKSLPNDHFFDRKYRTDLEEINCQFQKIFSILLDLGVDIPKKLFHQDSATLGHEDVKRGLISWHS